jgi:hypothetical protein
MIELSYEHTLRLACLRLALEHYADHAGKSVEALADALYRWITEVA